MLVQDCKVQMMTPLWILSETKPISVYGPPRFVCSGLNFRLNFCSALLGVRQAAAKHRRSIEDILITQLAETAGNLQTGQTCVEGWIRLRSRQSFLSVSWLPVVDEA